MSAESEGQDLIQAPRTFSPRQPTIEGNVLELARIPFTISMISLVSLLALTFIPYLLSAVITTRSFNMTPFEIPDGAGLVGRFLAGYAIHLILFLVTVILGIIGYRITAASGANPVQVIPPQDYELLAPLVAEGKADAIEQYVRLSSLSGFTGTFTQLGLTGLPLATIFLTLLFSGLSLWDADTFLDLAKLTLGAFIGSFVQRQVERRTDGATDVQSQTPASAR
jgi:hypothetical protein